MAEPTLTNIQILRSPVPHKRPDPGLMLDGQLAINYKSVDPGLFTKTVEGTLVKFGPVSITNNGRWPNFDAERPGDGFPGNSHGETWLDGRAAYWSPIHKIWDADKDNWITANGFTVDDTTGNFTLNKWLTVDRLYANYVSISDGLSLSGDLTTGGTNCANDIGSDAYRWRGLYGCLLNISGNTVIGGTVDIDGYTRIDGFLEVRSYADIQGTVTIGTIPTSGDVFTVNSPSYLSSTLSVVGAITGPQLTLSNDLTAYGNVLFGSSCDTTTLEVHSETTFHCQVNFNTNPVYFDSLIVRDDLTNQGNTTLGTSCGFNTLTVNSVSTFNCTTEHEGELRVGRISDAELRVFGKATINKELTLKGNISSSQSATFDGKVYTALTVDSDPTNTTTTKGWVVDWVDNHQHWVRNGVTVSPTIPGDDVIPNLGGGHLGLTTDPWTKVYAGDVHATGDIHATNVYATDVFTGDLHLTNDRGSWTLIEEEDVLTLRNNKTGKRYAISMTPYEG